MSLRGPVRQRPVAILAYGSLIAAPGPAIAPLVVSRRRWRTPFPVEFGRVSARWGGGPVLVPHPAGSPVAGALLVLSSGVGLGHAVDLLASREGAEPDCVIEVADGVPDDLLVIAASLTRNLPRPDMTPQRLARRAADSVFAPDTAGRNGVTYLDMVWRAGVRTPRAAAYRDAIMALAGASTLIGAQELLLRSAPRSHEEDSHGLG